MHSPLANVHVMNVCMQTDMHTHELWVLWVYTRVTGWWKGRHQGISREFPTSCLSSSWDWCMLLLYFRMKSYLHVQSKPWMYSSYACTCYVHTLTHLHVHFTCMYMLNMHISLFTCACIMLCVFTCTIHMMLPESCCAHVCNHTSPHACIAVPF